MLLSSLNNATTSVSSCGGVKGSIVFIIFNSLSSFGPNLIFIVSLIIPLTSGQVRTEECVESNDCTNNEICVNWKCIQAGEIPGANTETIDKISQKDNNPLIIESSASLIIAFGIIIGLIILGLLIRKRK